MNDRVRMFVAAGFATLLFSGCASTPPPKSGLPEGLDSMQCGQARIDFVWLAEARKLDLTLDGQTRRMVPVKSDTGVRFEVPTNENNYFWNRGETARLQIDGELYPQCVAPGGLELPFTARGNEPFWRVEVLPGQLWLETIDEPVVAMSWKTQVKRYSSRIIRAEDELRRVEIRAGRQLCRDTMTGMPYPYQVQLSLNGAVHQGCGGSPQQLIRGTDWHVNLLKSLPVVVEHEPRLRFGEQGRLSGNGGCNAFTGQYELTGEGLQLSVSATTLKACSDDVMEQESQFLAFLEQVVRFDIGGSGELVLLTGDGDRLTALKELQRKPPWER
jgi:heat shock protein HslJ